MTMFYLHYYLEYLVLSCVRVILFESCISDHFGIYASVVLYICLYAFKPYLTYFQLHIWRGRLLFFRSIWGGHKS